MKLLSMTRRLVLAGAAALPLMAGGQLASAAETIRFAVTDIAGLEDLQREYGAFRDKLAEALLKVIQGDVFQRFCADAGLEVATKGPDEFGQFLAAEYTQFGPIVKTAGLGISAAAR